MSNTVINEVIANGSIFANGYYGTGLANAFAFRSQSFVQEVGSANNAFVDVLNIHLASYASAPATVYFYNYNSPDRIEVYQGSTLITEIGQAIPLTASDRAALLSDTFGSFFNDSPDLYLKDFALSTINSLSYATFAGKMVWTHNPALGGAYTIRTSKGNGSFNWRYVVQYPIDGFTVGCPPLPPPAPGAPPDITIHVPAPTPPSPPTTIIVPTGDGGGCGCKIACTAMNDAYGFGSFRQKVWLTSAQAGSPEYQRGYHILFLPLVRYCYYSGVDNPLQRTLKYLLENVVKHRTTDIWKEKRGKKDPLGRIYRRVFEPICWIVGKLSERK
jgi:hypothetical protein